MLLSSMYISNLKTKNQEAKQLLKNFDCSVNELFIFVKKVSRRSSKMIFFLPQPRFHVTNPTKPERWFVWMRFQPRLRLIRISFG